MPPRKDSLVNPAGKSAEKPKSTAFPNAPPKPASWGKDGRPGGSKDGRPVKRKNPPQTGKNVQGQVNDSQPSGRSFKRAKLNNARSIASLASHAALKDGELNVQSFVASMAFEMNTLDESMRRTKAMNNRRVFQRLPYTMRRRAAAHNYKRVPKRLHKRARKEAEEDNSPTVNSKTRKPKTTRSRLRAETARRLEILAKRKRLLKLKKGLGADKVTITTRAARPKIRRNELSEPHVTKSRYRKRQLKKIWLPTHLWHAKRAKMTPPSQPLWGFSIPLSPTQKVYRPTHRIQWEKGAMAWDMSYMSTIGLFGTESSIRTALRGLGLTQEALWNDKAKRWRAGAVYWSGHLSRKSQDVVRVIGPACIIWNAQEQLEGQDATKLPRQLFINVHPSAFLETFNELLRLVKMQHPRPFLQDLRYEIGSIDITGPDATEALLGVLKPYPSTAASKDTHASKFESLAGLTDPAALPHGSLLAFSIMDPRLHHPPRRSSVPRAGDQDVQLALLEAISAFRKNEEPMPSLLFDRGARFKASTLPSQQSLNRRRGKNAPGAVLEPTKVDPPIPIMLLASRKSPETKTPGTWTVMLPWKCVLPLWYSLMHCPLSTGGNPAFGGLQEIRQLSFERAEPWFPGDVSGTDAGNAWELRDRIARQAAWDRMPKGKRVNWDTLDLGASRKGELGIGWNCDYDILFGLRAPESNQQPTEAEECENGAEAPESEKGKTVSPVDTMSSTTYLPKLAFNAYLAPKFVPLPAASLVTVNLRMAARGVPTTCARIYRLPDAKAVVISTQAEVPATEPPHQKAEGKVPANLREQWLAQRPAKGKKGSSAPPNMSPEARKQSLAQQLIGSAMPYPPASPTSENINGHPLCPNEEDLIGFVTTGSYNLRKGRGDGIGSLSAQRAMEELRRYKNTNDPAARLCVVRSAGENVGWLARWELV